MPEHYDVIVIGSGAGGSTLTYATILANALRVTDHLTERLGA